MCNMIHKISFAQINGNFSIRRALFKNSETKIRTELNGIQVDYYL